MGRLVVVGMAIAVGAAVIGLAWTIGDKADEGQFTTAGTAGPIDTITTDSVPTSAVPTSAVPTTAVPSALDGPPLEVSTLDTEPGATLTVAGDGCGVAEPPSVGAWEVRVWLTPAAGTIPWDPALGDPAATIAPRVDGSWSVDLRVPEWATEYRLEAACFDQAMPPAGFLYRHERVVASG